MFLEEQRTGSVSLSNVTTTASSMPGAVTDPATFNGLLLVDAQLNDCDFSFRVAVSVVWQGEAFLVEAFEDEAQARAWLSDAVQLVEWNRSGLTADPSGLYWKQASVPAWVKSWKQREDRACREATDEDYARLFPRPGTDEEPSGATVSSRSRRIGDIEQSPIERMRVLHH